MATNGDVISGGGRARGSLPHVPLTFDTQTQNQKQRPKPKKKDPNTFGTRLELLAWNNSNGGDAKLENPQPNVSMALILRDSGRWQWKNVGFAHERGSLQPPRVWVRERERELLWVKEKKRKRRKSQSYERKMRRVWV